MSLVKEELMLIEKSCADAFNKKDLSRLLSHFSDNITGFSSTEHDRFTGKDELKKTFEYYLSEADTVTYEIMDTTITQFGETAILSFYWRVTLKSGSKRLEIPGRGSHVFHKFGNEWKIIHEHFSRVH
jgi:ketosteroid isomerase-like protein